MHAALPQDNANTMLDNSPDTAIAAQTETLESTTVGDIHAAEPKLSCRNVDVFYADKQAINNVSLDIGRNEVIALIGPSGCGKSTFLRCLNRMNDTIPICRVTGNISLDSEDIYDSEHGCCATTRPGWYGVPKAQSVSQINLRECRLWAAYSWFGRE